MMQNAWHTPVMPNEVIGYLNLAFGNCVVDCTMGVGGHAVLIAEKIGTEGRIIGLDRDSGSLAIARENMKVIGTHCDYIHADYRHIDQVLAQLGTREVDGMLFDLGISSFQLNDPERGFSFRLDGPLDMRIDKEAGISAYDLVNSLSQQEIAAILKKYGQERLSNRIARYLVERRLQAPIVSTRDLRDIVLRALPRAATRQKIHPATRTFQAIRIAVNRELESLDVALEKSIGCLKQGARICVVSFHSLEDKIVKEKFRYFSRQGKIKLIVKKPLRPQEEEVNSNSRARSARLRVAEKI